MKRILNRFATAAGALALTCAAQAATVTNPGFESGLVAWEPSPTALVTVANSFSYFDWLSQSNVTFAPTEGLNMARLEAGTGLPTGQLADLFQNLGGALTQPLTFSYNFISFELADADGAIVGRDFVTISALDQNFNPLAETSFGVADLMLQYPQLPSPDAANLDPNVGWASGWRSFVAPAGTWMLQVTLESAIAGANGFNQPENQVQSFALFDVSPVPEPSTYAMLLAGMGMLGFMARRRLRVPAD